LSSAIVLYFAIKPVGYVYTKCHMEREREGEEKRKDGRKEITLLFSLPCTKTKSAHE
jgi:hypothetical protein